MSKESKRISEHQKEKRKQGYKNVASLVSPELYEKYMEFRKKHRLHSLNEFIEFIATEKYKKQIVLRFSYYTDYYEIDKKQAEMNKTGDIFEKDGRFFAEMSAGYREAVKYNHKDNGEIEIIYLNMED